MKFINCFSVLLFIVSGGNCFLNRSCSGPNSVYHSPGDLRLTFIVNECSSASLKNTLYHSFSWVCERLNILDFFGPFKLGYDIFNTCENIEVIQPLIDAGTSENYHLGVVTWKPITRKLYSLSQVLEVPVTEISKQWTPLVTASVGLITALKWHENLTLVVQDPNVFNYFYHESRKEWICVKAVKSFEDPSIDFANPVIAFGNFDQLNSIAKNITGINNLKIIFVPLDNTEIEGLPEGSYIIQPSYADTQQKVSKSPQIIPSSLLLDVASPIINIARNFSIFFSEKCNVNETTQNTSCLRIPSEADSANKFGTSEISPMSNREILNFLKIEPIYDKFFYNIFKVETLETFSSTLENISAENFVYSSNGVLQNFVKIGKYSLFNYTLMLDGVYFEEGNFTMENGSLDEVCSVNHKVCVRECQNFKEPKPIHEDGMSLMINLKQEPWVLAVLAVATLGVFFCLAILIFIFVRLCKKDIFEGNPVLSVLLLLTITIMYASVVPFTLDITSDGELQTSTTDYVCLGRSLAVTLTYSCAFSLMLSRTIMLATVAYEAGFMSHITGHVQSLLCLFMVAVQGALSLQAVEYCSDLFSGSTFIYLLSYDCLLLGLLICSVPFIYRSQRNYKEGMYFAISIILIGFFWISWLTIYVFLGDKWKMIVICVGLLGTASILMCTIFIPRTYLMTSAVVRDNLTSALPSLAFASSTSVLDLNYANTQHIYDCVNVAAINASNMQQTIPHALTQSNPNFYSEEPALDTERCETPDKVTRF